MLKLCTHLLILLVVSHNHPEIVKFYLQQVNQMPNTSTTRLKVINRMTFTYTIFDILNDLNV